MASIFDFLTSGTAPATGVTGTTSTTSLPPWYEDYQRNLLAAGVSTAAEPYQTYPFQRLADMTAAQREAIEGAKGYGRTMAPLAQLGEQATARGAMGFDPAELERVMSPYTADVTDVIGRRGMQRWEEEILPGLMDTFTGGGQFGSQRSMDFAGRASRDIQREIADEQALAMERGYGTALQGYGAARAADLAAGQQAAGLSRGALDILGAAGGTEQADIQRSLDLARQDFLEQRDYPKQQIDWLKALGSGISVPTSTAGTTAAPIGGAGPSPLQILAGIYGMTQMPTQEQQQQQQLDMLRAIYGTA